MRPGEREMNRRRFLQAVTGGLVAVPLTVEGQQVRTRPRLGMLLTGAPSDRSQARELEIFRRKLGELGWIDGRTLDVETQWTENPDRLSGLATELIRSGATVILAPGPAATRAARAITSTVPIVMIASADPRTAGAMSLAQPGGNVTGLTIGPPELVNEKRLELLTEAIPGIHRVAILWDVNREGEAAVMASLGAAGESLKLVFRHLDIATVPDFERVFDVAKQWKAEAILLVEGPRAVVHRTLIAELALKRRLPVMSQFNRLVEAGGLISYGPDLGDLFGRAASYVDKLLKGAQPADLPIEQPTKFELAINLKTAKALGLTIPPSLLARADEAIE